VKFVLTGGGTGGHVYPALAIAESLKTRYDSAEFLYIGVRGRAEEKIVPALGYAISFVTSAGITGGIRGKLTAGLRIGVGCMQAMSILIRFKPDAIIGTGGYASVPAVLAASMLRKLGLSKVKIFIHEQNYAPGRWNRMISRQADRVWTSFIDSAKFLPGADVEFTGYPVRPQISRTDKAAARGKLGLDQKARVLMVFGGSQGARTINRALAASLPELLKDKSLVVLHGTGASKSQEYDAATDTARCVSELKLDPILLQRYLPCEYFNDIQTYYAAADLLVCRGGAGTLNELLTCALPSIIIPKSSLAGEHQAVNALALDKAGAAEVIFERPVAGRGGATAVVDPDVLTGTVTTMLADNSRLEQMSHAAYEMRVIAEQSIYARSAEGVISGKPMAALTGNHAQPSWGNMEAVKLASLPPSGVVAHAGKVLAGLDNDGVEQYPNIRLLRYLADIYLVSPHWQVRNLGVKLAGLTLHQQRRNLLLSLASERPAASPLKRIFSKKTGQVGFIRRNAIASLAMIGQWDSRLEELLAASLGEDPYYEVRVEAANCIIKLKHSCVDNKLLTSKLLPNSSHKSPEVRWSCIEALGVTGTPRELSSLTDKLAMHPNWRIRQALLSAVEHLLTRGVVTPGNQLVKSLEQLIPTCTDFNPSFPLKRSLNRLRQLNQLENGQDEPGSGVKAEE
jgi:UDP-N-acetylglucosamine--N-acetylmuramyl-(pentapeptide) pyrophosphoryl-undecaprenol N-acetylglucosamine transferase